MKSYVISAQIEVRVNAYNESEALELYDEMFNCERAHLIEEQINNIEVYDENGLFVENLF